MRIPVERDRPSEQTAACRDRRRREAAQDRSDPQDQLFGGERLGEIVVRAERQAFDAVGLLLARSEQDDAHLAGLFAAAQLREHVEAGEAGEHEVQHDEVGPLLARRPQGVRPVTRGGNAIAFLCQVIGDEGGDVGLVVHDEDAMDGAGIGRHGQAGR